MNQIEIKDRFAQMWRQSRDDAGKSQEYMAKALGVSKKTIQNWESGTSAPSQEKGFEWFQVLGLQPLPYYLELIYPIEFGSMNTEDENDIETALFTLIRDLPKDSKRKLLYLLHGSHGSSPLAMMELITAHLQTPLRARLTIAEIVRTNYELALAQGNLAQPEHIQPNIDLLNLAFVRGKEAVMEGKNNYTAIAKGDDN